MATKTKTTKTARKGSKKAAADMKKAIGKPNGTEKAVAARTKPVRKTKAQRDAELIAAEKKAAATTLDNKTHESTVEKPCKVVWELADRMKGATRKDVMVAAIRLGVAFYTARTQYQLWSQATREQDRRRSEVGLKK